ncbi:MAG: flagellar biosynthesis protein FlhF [Gammaproteobacteria bacterium]|nr:flagellar biosynthesis protein FlhF [Gammaproteobacteria bacterium]MBI5615849.1 flagellar biosynthesis protein FlhF [Gammaproteobacteria bacterium]
MKVRRYFASSMRNALEMIRQEQGPDVLILSNRRVEGGFELLTAEGDVDPKLIEKFTPKAKPRVQEVLDDAEPAAAAQARVDAAPSPAAAARETPVGQRHFRDGVLWTNQETITQMQGELANIKALLQQQLSGIAWHDFESRSPERSRLLRLLAKAGIAPQLARQIVADVPEHLDHQQAWRRTLAILAARLRVRQDPVLSGGGRFALCGATGVGKTTLTAKLAARYALAHGSDKVALISADDQRLGAHQQLKIFGRLAGIAVHTIRNLHELPDCLSLLRDKPLLLIDSPGFPPDDPRFQELVATLGNQTRPIPTYLVLSATTDYPSIARITGAVANERLAGCMLTKLDEAAILGPALSAIMESGLPVAYMSAGQHVPDDLEQASAKALLQRMLSLAAAAPLRAEAAVIEQAFAI